MTAMFYKENNHRGTKSAVHRTTGSPFITKLNFRLERLYFKLGPKNPNLKKKIKPTASEKISPAFKQLKLTFDKTCF